MKSEIQHIIESQQFDRGFIDSLFASADHLEKKPGSPLKNKILATLFYEPSTRTRLSFESAMLRLGGSVITTENAREFSSAVKGETLEDSIRVVGNYADAIVLRHHEEGASLRAAAVSAVPIINAGDGAGQHPTQALLDLYTIKRELGKIDGITIAMVGDLKHGRTVRSLSYLLGKYSNISIIFVSPKQLSIGQDIKTYLNKHRIQYTETAELSVALKSADAIYQTRIQQERFQDRNEYLLYKGCYVLDKKNTQTMKKSAIILHPLPRVDEIAREVDASTHAVYFRQVHYGLLIRMALLKYIIKN